MGLKENIRKQWFIVIYLIFTLSFILYILACTDIELLPVVVAWIVSTLIVVPSTYVRDE